MEKKSDASESNSPTRRNTWGHKNEKQLKQRSHLALLCIELSKLKRDFQISLSLFDGWQVNGEPVPRALTSVLKAATSAKCNWAERLASSKHYVISVIKVIRSSREYEDFEHTGTIPE